MWVGFFYFYPSRTRARVHVLCKNIYTYIHIRINTETSQRVRIRLLADSNDGWLVGTTSIARWAIASLCWGLAPRIWHNCVFSFFGSSSRFILHRSWWMDWAGQLEEMTTVLFGLGCWTQRRVDGLTVLPASSVSPVLPLPPQARRELWLTLPQTILVPFVVSRHLKSRVWKMSNPGASGPSPESTRAIWTRPCETKLMMSQRYDCRPGGAAILVAKICQVS